MSESPPDKSRVDEAIKRAVANKQGGRPSVREFERVSGFGYSDIQRFYAGGWTEALAENGFAFPRYHAKLDPEELLKDWGRVARNCGKPPSPNQYKHDGKHSKSTLEKVFGKWSRIPERFQEFAQNRPEWADVLLLLRSQPPSTGTAIPAQAVRPGSPDGQQIPARSYQHAKFGGRPTYGNPIDFRGLRHEPVNEQGVVFLFGVVARELGYMVEAVQTGYPDCEAKRQVGKGKWERVRIEFEFESRNFRDQGHNADECDIIVCWRHNWPDCPIEVVELATEIKNLPNGG
jgi:hypothetical protein